MKIRSPLYLLAALWVASISSEMQRAHAQNALPTISSITFEGNRNIPTVQLKQFLERCAEGRPYIPAYLQYDLQRLRIAYDESGFLKAKVEAPDVKIETAGGSAIAVIRIVVDEGMQYKTGEIAVKNAVVLSPGTLVQLCPLQKGRPYSRKKVADWQVKIEEAYRELGYVKGRCPAREIVKDSVRTVDCTLECSEGKLYSVGKITLAGDGSVNLPEFKRRLLVSEGAAFNPEMLGASIIYINQMGLYKPISNADVEIRFDDEKGTVDLSFRIFAQPSQRPGS